MKKSRLLLMCLLPLIVLNHNYQEISLNRIFYLKEDIYGVLFYLDTCLACRNSKLYLLEQQRRDGLHIYFIDFSTCVFQMKNESNLNINEYEEIYIKVAPTLLIIENKIIIAELIGYKDIINYYQKSFYFSSL